MSTNKIVYLTDDLIQLFTGNNVLTSYGDTDEHYSNRVYTIPGGVYDSTIFGSIFSHQCNCGSVDTVGMFCTRCGSEILDEITAYRRYARIDLPVYYCTESKYQQMLKFLKSNFKFKFDILHPGFETSLNPKVLENLQFNWDEENEVIVVTDDITDISEVSFEGILKLIVTYFPSLVNEFRGYINSTILVVPIIMRPPVYQFLNGVKKLKNDKITVIYQNILYVIKEYYDSWYGTIKSEAGRALMRGSLRRYLNRVTEEMSTLLLTSKQNMARGLQSTRIGNSGRCTVVPAPDLKPDEVYIPTHLMYECCREEFIEYIQEHYGCGKDKAELIYKSQSDTDEIQQLFQQYIEGDPNNPSTAKYVLINRNPTLHELNILMCRVRLTRDYCMKLPMVICAPTNGDFDGDTYSFYAVPKKSNVDYLETMSPKNIIYYKKNHAPLFMPSHEIMMGLLYATKVIIPEEYEEFDDLNDAYAFRKKNRKFKWQTLFRYQGNLTTLARERLSEYFGKDINGYLGSFEKTLNSKNIIPLYVNLEEFEDRMERIQKIQEFALNIATISGATAPTLSQLHSEVDSEILDQIRKIESDETLTEQEKDIKVRDLYNQYVKQQEELFDDSVKLTITESSRAKISQLMNIVVNQLNVGPDGSTYVSETRLIDGMNPRDYMHLAVENRAVQDIKVSAVPLGGYLTRQFAFLAMSYSYSDSEDVTNPGILIEASSAEGRTDLEGNIIPKTNSKDLVRVRSIITSTTSDPYVITKDMVPNIFHYKDGSRIGISLMTSLTEGLTQAGLSLKHGGALFQIEPNGNLTTSQDCTVEVDDLFITLKTKTKIERYPKPENFVQSFESSGFYKAGTLIGSTFKLNSPAYRLDSVITLCEGKRVNPNKRFAKNRVLITDCYACNSGTIHYKMDTAGNIKVFIDDVEYDYNPEAMYLFPDGALVSKYDRICSGTLNLRRLTKRVSDYVEVYYYFRNQMNELISGIAPELLEFLYVLIVKKSNGQIKVQSVVNSIYNSKSFYTAIAFGYAKKKFKSIGVEGVDFIGDTMTQVMLSLIVNDLIV